MNIYDFMSNSPYLTAFMAWLIYEVVVTIIKSMTVMINGYPHQELIISDVKNHE